MRIPAKCNRCSTFIKVEYISSSLHEATYEEQRREMGKS